MYRASGTATAHSAWLGSCATVCATPWASPVPLSKLTPHTCCWSLCSRALQPLLCNHASNSRKRQTSVTTHVIIIHRSLLQVFQRKITHDILDAPVGVGIFPIRRSERCARRAQRPPRPRSTQWSRRDTQRAPRMHSAHHRQDNGSRSVDRETISDSPVVGADSGRCARSVPRCECALVRLEESPQGARRLLDGPIGYMTRTTCSRSEPPS